MENTFFNSMFENNPFKNMQGFDTQALMQRMKNSADVMSQTNQMVAETLQNILKHNSEMMQRTTSETFNMIREMSSVKNPEQAFNKHKENTQLMMSNAFNNFKDTMEINTNAAINIYDFMSKKASEIVKDCMSTSK